MSSPGGDRPRSPTYITRHMEKEQLIHLNDRLANYIDRVRSLEIDNKRLTVQIRTFEESSQKEVTNLRDLYEKELQSARSLVDDLAGEKAKLQVDIGRLKADTDDAKFKLAEKEKALKDAQLKINLLEPQLAELQTKNAELLDRAKHADKEKDAAVKEKALLDKQLETCKKQLEAETLARVNLENKLQTLKEELSFRDQMHTQELSETRSRLETSYDEVDGRIQREYEAKLADALRQMRAEHGERLAETRKESDILYKAKISNLENQLAKLLADESSSRTEVRENKKMIDNLRSQLNSLISEKAMLESRVKDLQNALESEKEKWSGLIEIKNNEIAELRLKLNEQLQEYQDLMDMKIALDIEIAAYRKLLESEEDRLSISLNGGGGGAEDESASYSTSTTTTASSSSSRLGKRKRTGEALLSSASQQQVQVQVKSSHKGPAELHEFDYSQGHYVRVVNNGEKDQSLNGWLIKVSAGEKETSYKLPRTATLKPQQHLNVWTANIGKQATAPTDYVLKSSQRWPVGGGGIRVIVTLSDPTGEEMSKYEAYQSQTSSRLSGAHGRHGEGQNREACFIM